MSLLRTFVPALVVLASCASRTPGAQPHEASVATHETRAAQAEQAAGEHEARYDATAQQRRERCQRPVATAPDACWTSVTNPTAEHLKHAEALRKQAADHRAASQALRDAESRACVGIPEADRDESPFDRREDIERVEPLSTKVTSGKASFERLEGATVVFRAVPGLTAQWLQRLVDCHIARNAALGHDVPEMPSCPLVPKDVQATVNPTATGFAVQIRSADADSAKEVLRRAESLVR